MQRMEYLIDWIYIITNKVWHRILIDYNEQCIFFCHLSKKKLIIINKYRTESKFFLSQKWWFVSKTLTLHNAAEVCTRLNGVVVPVPRRFNVISSSEWLSHSPNIFFDRRFSDYTLKYSWLTSKTSRREELKYCTSWFFFSRTVRRSTWRNLFERFDFQKLISYTFTSEAYQLNFLLFLYCIYLPQYFAKIYWNVFE